MTPLIIAALMLACFVLGRLPLFAQHPRYRGHHTGAYLRTRAREAAA